MEHDPLSPAEIAAVSAVAAQFHLYGDVTHVAAYGSGHINDTFVVHMNVGGTALRYLFQRINNQIFKDVPALMSNIDRVCSHVQQRLQAEGVDDATRRSLCLIRARNDRPYAVDVDGKFWRVYVFVERAIGYDIIENEQQAFIAAQAFANFQKYVSDLPGERLHETIPDFHNTRKRFATLQQAIADDASGRVKEVQGEIDFVLERESLAGELLDLCAAGDISERVTHNDTKLNNVLLDQDTDEAMCVIDLDTLMPGLAHYDFGDLVRTSTSPVAEDEKDPTQVVMQMHMYEAVLRGFLDAGRDYLNDCEIDNLPLGAKTITFECGVRFLTDYLQGDVYFKTKYAEHNLVRCRTQFALVKSMEDQWDAMCSSVKSIMNVGV